MQRIFGFYEILHQFMFRFCSFVVVGTRDGLGLESQLGHDFLHPSRLALELTQPPLIVVPDLSPG